MNNTEFLYTGSNVVDLSSDSEPVFYNPFGWIDNSSVAKNSSAVPPNWTSSSSRHQYTLPLTGTREPVPTKSWECFESSLTEPEVINDGENKEEMKKMRPTVASASESNKRAEIHEAATPFSFPQNNSSAVPPNWTSSSSRHQYTLPLTGTREPVPTKSWECFESSLTEPEVINDWGKLRSDEEDDCHWD